MSHGFDNLIIMIKIIDCLTWWDASDSDGGKASIVVVYSLYSKNPSVNLFSCEGSIHNLACHGGTWGSVLSLTNE